MAYINWFEFLNSNFDSTHKSIDCWQKFMCKLHVCSKGNISLKEVKNPFIFLVTYSPAVSGVSLQSACLSQRNNLAVPDTTFLAGKFSLRDALKSTSSGLKVNT